MSPSNKVYIDGDYYKNFLSKNWGNNPDTQLASLKALEDHMAKEQGRKKSREIKDADLGDDYGSYSYEKSNVLKINLERLDKDYNKSGDKKLEGMSGYFAMATGIHEGIHASQQDAINNELKNNPYNGEELKVIGRDLIYGSADSHYIERPSESDAFKRTLIELSKIREKIAQSKDAEELKKFDAFLSVYKEEIKDKEKEACEYHGTKDFEIAKQKAVENTDKKCELRKDWEKSKIATIKELQNKIRELKSERKKKSSESKKSLNVEIRDKKADLSIEKSAFKNMLKTKADDHHRSLQEVIRQIKSVDSGKGLVSKEKGDGLTLSYSVKVPDDGKIPESSQPPKSSKSPPDPAEKEQNKQAHLTEIKWLNKEIVFLEKSLKTTNHEPSRQSLENTIKVLKESQEKMAKSLQVKHGITPDELIEYRELVASQGGEAVKRFDHTGQHDAGVLADAAHKAVPVPKPHEPSQDTKTKSEQEKIAHALVELKEREKELSEQLHNPKKPMDPLEIKKIEGEIAKKREEYKAKFAEVVNRPDKEQILHIWERIPKDGLTKDARKQEKIHNPSRER